MICSLPTEIAAQKAGNSKTKHKSEVAVKESTKKAPVAKGPITIEKFITPTTKIQKGLTTVYQQDDKYFLNINDSILGRDILLVNRISKAAQGIRTAFEGYSGDQISSNIVRFVKGPNNKIFLQKISHKERSANIDGMAASVARSNTPAILASFEIKAQSTDKQDNIILISDFLANDSEYLFFTKRYKKIFRLAAMQKDKSYISSIKSFPINTEIKCVKTYAHSSNGETATFEHNSSFLMLPKEPMTPRYADDRVGYFTTKYVDYDKNPQGIKDLSLITRWRLEPKPEDVDKYMRGELVEPAKPIVYYIDPTTPKEWVPYLIQGINDWQKVFEKAGFKNAIYALEAPTFEQDSTWSLEDARHSAVIYKPSSTPNASGPNVHDPRSGEIMESHINWYHNVMLLLRNWYFIQCSPSDPDARNMTFDQELMGELIRFVSSHEVGHTLGLRHNFAGTSLYTTKQLRDPKFLAKNGHTTSIMDYSRFNYVAQPEDNIPQKLLFPSLSHYDYWAIEWGYRRFPAIDNADAELTKLNNWIIEKTKDRRFWFGSESSPSDPRSQAEDLGENQMEANALGIKNLKLVIDSIFVWTKVPNNDYVNLKTIYVEVASQYNRYLGHVATYVGGVYEEPKRVEEAGAIYTPVDKAKQKEAIAFLNKYAIDLPLWLVPDVIMNKLVLKADLTLDKMYANVFKRLLSKRVMMNLYTDECINGNKAYTMTDLFQDLNKSVWGNLSSGGKTHPYKRIQQKVYVHYLAGLHTGELSPMKRRGANNDNSDISSTIYAQLLDLQSKLKSAATKDFTTKAHYSYLIQKIQGVLDNGTLDPTK